MAWIYLAELVELDSHSVNGSEQSLIVSKTGTHRAFYCHECNRVTLTERQSGTMCKPCTKNTCQKSTLSLVASHARTLVVQELVWAWAESAVDFSTRLSDLQKKLTHRLCFSKTSQQLELEDFEKSQENLPISGMIVGGRVYLPQKLEPVTCEKDGFSLPTPTAQTYGSNQTDSMGAKKRERLETKARKGMLPTPMARDWKGMTGINRHSPSLADTVDNYLNPAYVEEIMGYKIGFTALSAWATRWFHSKQEKRLKGC